MKTTRHIPECNYKYKMISIFLFFKNFISIKILFGLIELNIIINKMKFYAPNQISIHGIQKNIFFFLFV